jgi:hypothetical protein
VIYPNGFFEKENKGLKLSRFEEKEWNLIDSNGRFL